MTIDNVQTTVTEFVKRLQLPESKYSFAINSGNDSIELIINVDNVLACSISISNGSLKMIYDNEYGALDYVAQNFLTPITLLYQLCIIFYATIKNVTDFDFNDLLSVVLMNEIYDWKTLVQGISENLNLPFRKFDNYVTVNDVPIHYSGFTNTIKIDNTEIKLEDSNYTSVVEAMFKCVEYVANLMDSADNLFEVPEQEENNLLEEEEENDENVPSESGSDFNFDMDIDMNEEEPTGEESEPVEPMENETFEEPQGPVITPDDVI